MGSGTNILDIMSLIGSGLLIIGVIVLTYYASRWYARKMGAGGGSRHMKVIDRIGLGRTSALLIVQVGEKYYLIGVSEKSIQMLSELDEPVFTADLLSNGQPAGSFASILGGFMGGKKDPEKKQDDGGLQ